jgi:histidinol phosphatase-like enzyme
MTEKYGLDPSSCWVIGDKWIDPQTGLDAGMRGALVRTGKPIDQALEQKAAPKKVPIYMDLVEFVTKGLIG